MYLKGSTTISGNGTNASYGVLVGYASTNVPAYSNGNDTYFSYDDNHLYGIFMGMKWQCVEYARRWLFIRKGCVFGITITAADIWTQLNSVERVVDKKHFPLKAYPNGSPYPPKNESLVIYPRHESALPNGHIAVIVDVLPGFIRVAEQIYNSYYWSGNYSRQIQYFLINESYWIDDDYPILGWMSVVDDNNETQPLNQQTIDAITKLNQSLPDPTSFINSTISSNVGICPHFSVYYCLLLLSFCLYFFINHY